MKLLLFFNQMVLKTMKQSKRLKVHLRSYLKNWDIYRSTVNIQIAREKESTTLSQLLVQISPKELTEESLLSISIRNMYTINLLAYVDLGIIVKNKATV